MNQRLESLERMDQIRLARLLQKAHKGLSDKELGQLIELIQTIVSFPTKSAG